MLAVVLKPKPAIVMVVASAASVAVLLVTTGTTLATWTFAVLATPLVVTVAVRGPAAVGLVERLIVRSVPVALVTVPAAPLLNATKLFPAVVSKPDPLMVIVVALAARFTVLAVITGTTVAT